MVLRENQAAHTTQSTEVAEPAGELTPAVPAQREPGTALHSVPIDSLREADSPRSQGIDHRHARVLAENIDKLPPILVHRETMRVVDGMHRLQAFRLRQYTTVGVRYFDGPESDAFIAAVESNTKHGLPLSLQDRKTAALRIISSCPKWSDRAIASKVGLDHKTVGSLRRGLGDLGTQPSIRIGLDGRSRPLDATGGRRRAEQAIAQDPKMSLRDIAKSAGVSTETARSVRKGIQQGEVPAARGALDGTAAEISTVLESLKEDPSVRYNNEGRTQLRWLEARLISECDAERLIRLPVHQATRLAFMARTIAAQWSVIAQRLENRLSADQ